MLGDLARRFLGYEGSALFLRQLYRSFRLWLQRTFKYRFCSIGKGVVILGRTKISPGSVSIGDYTAIGSNCWLEGRIQIGRFVMIASDVTIGAQALPQRQIQCDDLTRCIEIRIEDDVWIGRGASITEGVTIGEGSVVAARSFVDRDVPPYSIVGGLTARVYARRFKSAADIERHRQMLSECRDAGSDFSVRREGLHVPDNEA